MAMRIAVVPMSMTATGRTLLAVVAGAVAVERTVSGALLAVTMFSAPGGLPLIFDFRFLIFDCECRAVVQSKIKNRQSKILRHLVAASPRYFVTPDASAHAAAPSATASSPNLAVVRAKVFAYAGKTHFLAAAET